VSRENAINQRIIWFALVALALASVLLILWACITPLSWAIALAVLVHPLHVMMLRVRVHPSVAAAVLTASLGICVVIPAVWVTHTLFVTALTGLDTILPRLPAEHSWSSFVANYPLIGRILGALGRVVQPSDILHDAVQRLSKHGEALLRVPVLVAAHSVLTLFIVFFLLRDSTFFLQGLKVLLPFSKDETERLLVRIHDTIHAALFGTLAVSAIQGMLGALLLFWLQLPAAIVWGVIMALLAVMPYLGAFVIWIPLAIFLALQGSWDKALVTTAWGTIVIGLSDNLLYPYLVGRRLHYHSLVVFFFLLGGVLVFGPAGIVLGPISLAIAAEVLSRARAAQGAVNGKSEAPISGIS
jgi:predicted PurR-regulated permease PerM